MSVDARPLPPSRRVWNLAAWCAAALLIAGAASAQNPHESVADAGVADVPPGTARIIGRLSHPRGDEKTEGSTIVLYSLSADGNPGMRAAKADAHGTFTFDHLSNASGITYLVGASYRGVPYGKRVSFASGQNEMSLVIEVDDPSSDVSSLSIGTSSLRVVWLGASLGIEEVHQIDNASDDVVYVPKGERAGKRPPFHITLPEGATDVDTSLSGVGEGYEVDGRELSYWGPVYEGGFELRFGYLLPIPGTQERGLSIRWQLDAGSRGATLLFPPDGPTVAVAGVAAAPDVEVGEVSYHSLDLGAIRPGGHVDMKVTLPEMSADVGAISIPHSEVWLDVDDTFIQVNVDVQLDVAPGAHLAGSPAAPLLTFDLPEGAEWLGESPSAQRMGLAPLADGDLGLVGPLAPGRSVFGYGYRVPVKNGKPHLDLAMPAAVGTLDVLIADTGVVVQTDRLHRLRPFRDNTRVYLHRQAFAVAKDEVVPLGLELIDRGSASPTVHLLSTSLLAALGVWFIVSPLFGGRGDREVDYEKARIRSERDIVYQSIRDLEHDFETAKIEESEYHAMREELRARGLALLQRERDATQRAELPAAPREAPRPAPPAQTPSTPPARDRAKFCVACGDKVQASWRFCANCGAEVPERPSAAEADA